MTKFARLDVGMPWPIMDGDWGSNRHCTLWTTAIRPALDPSGFHSSLSSSSTAFSPIHGQARHQYAMTLTTATSSTGRGHACQSQFLEFGGRSPALAAAANAEFVTGRQGFLCGPQSKPVHIFSDGGSSPSSLPHVKGQGKATAFNCDAANLDDKLKITVNVHLPKWMRTKFPPNSQTGGCGVKATPPEYGACEGNPPSDGLNLGQTPTDVVDPNNPNKIQEAVDPNIPMDNQTKEVANLHHSAELQEAAINVPSNHQVEAATQTGREDPKQNLI